MAEPNRKKGTVTAVGSQFPADDAQKASQRVQDAIADRRRELDRLNSFAADNSALTKLVRHLPDEISHEIMVPFGRAAFFPGRLVHTNEFLVLLGEGYYAERTSKQTVEILKRRGKSLESQVEALKASLSDLEAEAKFFASTAAEAEEGVVEIREEYIEEPQAQQENVVDIREEYTDELRKGSVLGATESGSRHASMLPNEKDEYARIMARLDELEKEELDAENASGSDEDEDLELVSDSESAPGSVEDEDSESVPEAVRPSGVDLDEAMETDFGSSMSKVYSNDDRGKSIKEIDYVAQKLRSVYSSQIPRGQDLDVLQSTENPTAGGSHQPLPNVPISDSNSKNLARDGSVKSSIVSFHSDHIPQLQHESKDSSNNTASKSGKSGSSERKAFTGSVVEHTEGLLQSGQPAKGAGSDQPTKPVSRFKMMRGNR